MKTHFSTSISDLEDGFEAGREAAKQALSRIDHAQPNLAILFCSSRYDYASVIRGVQKTIGEQVPLIGCTTAGQFTETSISKEGVVCALIASEAYSFFTGVGTMLKNNPLETIKSAMITFPKSVKGYQNLSAIIFVDGLVGKGEEAVLACSKLLGPDINLAGAAAADDFNFKETSVFRDQEAFTDAASICLIASRSPVVLSVSHGHHSISPALKITKSKENILYELEGRPALEIWKEFLRDHLKKKKIDVETLKDNEWSKIFLEYEAGLMTGEDYKIRFPLSCNQDGSINFICPLIEGTSIKIMDSEPKDQIESIRSAAELAMKALPKGTQLSGALILDCACRTLILKKQFSKGIKEIKKTLGSIPFIGCETYGEIALEKGQSSGFHNATTVVMLFPT